MHLEVVLLGTMCLFRIEREEAFLAVAVASDTLGLLMAAGLEVVEKLLLVRAEVFATEP